MSDSKKGLIDNLRAARPFLVMAAQYARALDPDNDGVDDFAAASLTYAVAILDFLDSPESEDDED